MIDGQYEQDVSLFLNLGQRVSGLCSLFRPFLLITFS